MRNDFSVAKLEDDLVDRWETTLGNIEWYLNHYSGHKDELVKTLVLAVLINAALWLLNLRRGASDA